MAVNKYVICVEGQGEMIFIRRLLEELFGFSDISYECVELRGGDLNNVPHEHKPPNAKMFYLIINIGNDEKVLGFIKGCLKGDIGVLLDYEICTPEHIEIFLVQLTRL